MGRHKHIDFFETQFQRQIQDGELALNSFEKLAISYVAGTILDLGCGLGNLSLQLA